MTYFENYKDGQLTEGVTTTKAGENLKYSRVSNPPEPKLGMVHFYKFVAKNFRLSKEANSRSTGGKIFLTFVVTKDGEIENIKMIKGLGFGLDEEAVRVLQKHKTWQPGKFRGVNTKYSYSLPITINIQN